jgi:putative protease
MDGSTENKMDKLLTPEDHRIHLPLIAGDVDNPPPQNQWQGWQPAEPVVWDENDSPLPQMPQGEYNLGGESFPLSLPEVQDGTGQQPVELLAPAGGMDAAFAAFHFGADAIYLGLKKFSARAEAENFTLEQVDEITAYAHSLNPPRHVFVTINTLIRQDEVAELIETVAALAAIGVDAIILQDLGVYYLLRRHFPTLELHASTQLAVHNQAGAVFLKELGFERVVLARELTFEEVHDITATAGIETEVFIHGALCYSYSGLCLFSSQTLGRSGNRGKCAYSCRDSYEVTGAPLTLRDGTSVRRDPRQGFPFSMKDLALPDHLPALRAAGVSCFKVEGRKKSPLYVATTIDYYRKWLDGRMTEEQRPILESDMQAVFSRPWTRLFVQSHKDKEVADRDTVGHRGTPIGKVERVIGTGTDARLRFRSSRGLQLHDGLQVDLPVLGKPFGFAVDHLWLVTGGRKEKRSQEFETPAGSLVEVGLPSDHPPLPAGAPVYCSSSQEVKNRYRFDHPKPGAFRVRIPVAIRVMLQPEQLTVTGRVLSGAGNVPEITATLPGPFEPANDVTRMKQTVRETFDKLGQTRFTLAEFNLDNPACLFVPVSRLNALRRTLMDNLDASVGEDQQEKAQQLQATLCPRRPKGIQPTEAFRWSIKVDRVAFLAALEEEDVANIDEILIDITRDQPTLLREKLDEWSDRIGRDHIRLALPPLTRRWEEKSLRRTIAALQSDGWTKWEAANLSAWNLLEINPVNGGSHQLDMATDWSIYVINRLAALQLREMGVTRFALSPEDGLHNMRSLLTEFPDQAVVIVHQDTPQFLAESCAYANLIGGCPGKANCKFESMEMVSSHGEKVTALDYHCRTIVLNQGPFCLSTRLKPLSQAGAVLLRADFIYRNYAPEEVRNLWRAIRAGNPVTDGHAANFDRGIL